MRLEISLTRARSDQRHVAGRSRPGRRRGSAGMNAMFVKERRLHVRRRPGPRQCDCGAARTATSLSASARAPTFSRGSTPPRLTRLDRHVCRRRRRRPRRLDRRPRASTRSRAAPGAIRSRAAAAPTRSPAAPEPTPSSSRTSLRPQPRRRRVLGDPRRPAQRRHRRPERVGRLRRGEREHRPACRSRAMTSWSATKAPTSWSGPGTVRGLGGNDILVSDNYDGARHDARRRGRR